MSSHRESQEDLLKKGWKSLEMGRIEEALEWAHRIRRGYPQSSEGLFLYGASLVANGIYQEGLEALEASEGKVVDEALHRWYLGSANFYMARFEAAKDNFRRAIKLDLDFPDAVYELARTLEHLGEHVEAQRLFHWASDQDEEAFPVPLQSSREEFDEVLQDARDELPKEILDALESVSIVVEDLPSKELLENGKPVLSPDILGLFTGRSLKDESVFALPTMPPTVYLFRRNLERVCRDYDELREEIQTTLYHEVGHYLGLDEEELEERGLD